MKTKIFLNNIRSAHNVGAIFRTADGAGVSEILLGGYTPTPTDRFARVQPEIQKTSLGASKTVPWQHVPQAQTVTVLQEYQQQGYTLIAVEQTAAAISLYEYARTDGMIFIFGNEVSGVEQELLEIADQVIAIPMRGTKESLNVATSVGIVLFQK